MNSKIARSLCLLLVLALLIPCWPPPTAAAATTASLKTESGILCWVLDEPHGLIYAAVRNGVLVIQQDDLKLVKKIPLDTYYPPTDIELYNNQLYVAGDYVKVIDLASQTVVQSLNIWGDTLAIDNGKVYSVRREGQWGDLYVYNLCLRRPNETIRFV